MIDLARNGFTHEQIKAALHSSNRQIDFRYELLDSQNHYLQTLTNITGASVSEYMLSQIKRTAKFNLIEDGTEIDFLNNRIKPVMRLFIPEGRILARDYAFFSHIQSAELRKVEGSLNTGWVEFPLGVFLLSSPTRNDGIASVYREIEAYDLTLILRDDKFLDRYTIMQGEKFYDALVGILASAGITQYNVEQTDKVLPRTIEFEPGTAKLEAINDLLTMLNYTPIYVDEVGYFTSRLYVSPTDRSADYVYFDDNESVIHMGVVEELDTFNVPNVFFAVRTNEEEEPLMSTHINDNPDSPTSTVNRSRQIVDHREIDDIADQEALDAYVKRVAFDASQVYGRIQFNTALMPFHGYADVLQLRYEGLDINDKYLELNWEMELQVGGRMKHELRQVVIV